MSRWIGAVLVGTVFIFLLVVIVSSSRFSSSFVPGITNDSGFQSSVSYWDEVFVMPLQKYYLKIFPEDHNLRLVYTEKLLAVSDYSSFERLIGEMPQSSSQRLLLANYLWVREKREPSWEGNNAFQYQSAEEVFSNILYQALPEVYFPLYARLATSFGENLLAARCMEDIAKMDVDHRVKWQALALQEYIHSALPDRVIALYSAIAEDLDVSTRHDFILQILSMTLDLASVAEVMNLSADAIVNDENGIELLQEYLIFLQMNDVLEGVSLIEQDIEIAKLTPDLQHRFLSIYWDLQWLDQAYQVAQERIHENPLDAFAHRYLTSIRHLMGLPPLGFQQVGAFPYRALQIKDLHHFFSDVYLEYLSGEEEYLEVSRLVEKKEHFFVSSSHPSQDQTSSRHTDKDQAPHEVLSEIKIRPPENTSQLEAAWRFQMQHSEDVTLISAEHVLGFEEWGHQIDVELRHSKFVMGSWEGQASTDNDKEEMSLGFSLSQSSLFYQMETIENDRFFLALLTRDGDEHQWSWHFHKTFLIHEMQDGPYAIIQRWFGIQVDRSKPSHLESIFRWQGVFDRLAFEFFQRSLNKQWQQGKDWHGVIKNYGMAIGIKQHRTFYGDSLAEGIYLDAKYEEIIHRKTFDIAARFQWHWEVLNETLQDSMSLYVHDDFFPKREQWVSAGLYFHKRSFNDVLNYHSGLSSRYHIDDGISTYGFETGFQWRLSNHGSLSLQLETDDHRIRKRKYRDSSLRLQFNKKF